MLCKVVEQNEFTWNRKNALHTIIKTNLKQFMCYLITKEGSEAFPLHSLDWLNSHTQKNFIPPPNLTWSNICQSSNCPCLQKSWCTLIALDSNVREQQTVQLTSCRYFYYLCPKWKDQTCLNLSRTLIFRFISSVTFAVPLFNFSWQHCQDLRPLLFYDKKNFVHGAVNAVWVTLQCYIFQCYLVKLCNLLKLRQCHAEPNDFDYLWSCCCFAFLSDFSALFLLITVLTYQVMKRNSSPDSACFFSIADSILEGSNQSQA